MERLAEEKKARVFFALWPDEAGRAALSAWQPGLRKLCGGRAMRAETLHATLVFLGNVPQARLEALQEAAREVEGESFEIIFDTARYWGHNHIVYAAPPVTPPQLALLVQDMEQSLLRRHFRFDQREYKPHVTLLRNAQWGGKCLPAVDKVVWRMREFVLVHSSTDAQGANYRMLARFGLR